MKKLIEFHVFQFKHCLKLSKIFTLITLTTCIFIVHTLALRGNNELWIAITMRFYHIPILYTAIFLGFIMSIGVSTILASVHLFVMLIQENHVHTVMLEHLVETPFLVILGVAVGFLRDFILFEINKKNEIVDLFGKYISPQLVNDLINKKIKTEGEEKDFTKLAERLKPTDLIFLLNTFFSEMVDIILQNKGFLDKFIGDAIMVVFGIPESKSHDKQTAVHVAIQMLKKLRQLNEKKSFGDEKLEITIGIHSGRVVAGNVGSSERREYTIVGDNVNLASRVQNLNKFYHSNFLISDSVYQGIIEQQDFKVREIDSVRVKGKQIPCVLFEVYSHLFYKSGDFQQAKILFEQALKQNPEDILCTLYLERIKDLLENKIEGWDGIYDFKNK